ncbi:MAG: rRNA maturation RNase YbeY [Chthoniobacterales bacterium]|nr:rRNA maturation RNase YbeY [Chthoniobacterales bacterium]
MRISVVNLQAVYALRKGFIRSVVREALPSCLRNRKRVGGVLDKLGEILIALLGDEEIGRVHLQFFNDARPTDVITFPYGEVVLGVGEIVRNAKLNGCSPEEEVARCLVHALLHLQGYEDRTETGYEEMVREQELILAEVRKKLKIP